MKKLASFIVNKRFFILAIMLAVAIAFAACMPFVKTNDDMTKYLPSGSQMRHGLTVMEEAFPESESENAIRVMFDDLEQGEALVIMEKLAGLEHVNSVDYDGSQNYHKDNHTLFVLNISCEYGSAEEGTIVDALKTEFSDYKMVYKNNDSTPEGIPTWVLIVAMAILVAVLLTMSGSWFEPVLFLAVIGIAVVINMGSNIILGSISTITASIAAILQLVLSMDYSIILTNRYRQERRLTDDKQQAMKNALANSFVSISSSSFTTVIGLLMLCFMSFTIGMDLGLVLAKGVFISLLCVFMILPTLILLCDKIILKTEKKFRRNKKAEQVQIAEGEKRRSLADAVPAFEFKARYAVMALFVAIFAFVCVFQTYTPIEFSSAYEDPILEIFPQNNPIVIVYDNEHEDGVTAIVKEAAENEHILGMTSYADTLGAPYSAEELSYVMGAMGSDLSMDASLVRAIFYDKLDGTLYPVQAGTFFAFFYQMAESESFSALIPAEMQGQIQMLYQFSDRSQLTVPLPAAALAGTFGMSEEQVQGILLAGEITGDASIHEFINLAAAIAQDPSAGMDEATVASLIAAQTIVNAVVSETEYAAGDMAALIGLNDGTAGLLYLMYASNTHYNESWRLSLHAFVNHLAEMAEGSFSALLDGETKASIAAMNTQLNDGAAQLKGEKHSRIILNAMLPEDNEETTAFYDDLTQKLDALNAEYYLIGSTAMNYEMSHTIDKDLLLITILTVVAIFLVVAGSFRNLVIPAILVLLVQCGVYITVVALHVSGVNYLALLIVECLLMGATIDYGILFTNYYREHRAAGLPPREAVKSAYKGSIHTILTSGLILILVTGIIAFLSSGTMSEICLAIAIGSLSATTLILLILPAFLMAFDKLVMHKLGARKKPQTDETEKAA